MLGFNTHLILSLRESKSDHSREAGEQTAPEINSSAQDVSSLDSVASLSSFESSPKKLSILPFKPSTEFRKEKLFPRLESVWFRTMPSPGQQQP